MSFQAKDLFLKGVENEQNGKLYEAIQYYRRAVQLVPDIEFRLYEATKLRPIAEKSNGEYGMHLFLPVHHKISLC